MADTPAPKPTPSADAKLTAMRCLAYAVVLAVSAAGQYLGLQWLSALGGLLGIVAGKLLGVPLTQVTEAALKQLASTKPERASEVAINTLASLPPASAQATIATIASMAPPRAPDAPTVIRFVGGESITPAPEPDPAERPTRPDRPPRSGG